MNAETIKCGDLKRCEDGCGWSFEVDGKRYRTDRHGEGLWFCLGDFWYQCVGTCQFSLRGIKTASGARRHINRFIELHWRG